MSFIEQEALRARRQAEDDARDRKVARLLAGTKLRGRFQNATFSSFCTATAEQRLVLETCRAYAESIDFDAGSNLWLIGPVGTGKTHLCAAIALAVATQRGRSAVVVTARELVRDLRSGWRRNAESTEADAIEHYGAVPLLAIDELGTGFGSDAEQMQVLDVVDRRYQLRRPTVLASNLNAPLLRAAIGERTFDRLRENARFLVLDWPSHRQPLQDGSAS